MATKLSHMLGTEDGFADDAAVAAYLLANPQILLKKGCFYFNSTAPVSIRFWNGTVWVALGSNGGVYTDKTLAQLEALAPVAGDIGFPTDSTYQLRCLVGGTWSYYVDGVDQALTKPPVADWSWGNQRTAAVSTAGGILTLSRPLDAVTQAALYYRAIPGGGAPWTATALLRACVPFEGGINAGLSLYTSGTDRLGIAGNFGVDGSGRVQKWTSLTAFSADSAQVARYVPKLTWWRVGDTGANVTWEMSVDGVAWRTVLSEARGVFMGVPNNFGIGLYSELADVKIEVLSLTTA